ncbi:MAG: hypothetical protein WBA57_07700 [Elainellaceae cyanobacterium]
MTLPLAGFGQKNVKVQVNESAVFVGEVRDLAAPYLLTTMGISLGVGAVSLAGLGWKQCSQKLSEAEDKLLSMKKQVDEQVALVESIKFSEQRIEAFNLSSFLQPDDNASAQPSSELATSSIKAVAEPAKNQINALDTPAQNRSHVHHAATHPRHLAQTLSYGARADAVEQESMGQPDKSSRHLAESNPQALQINELLNQIQVIAAQVESMNVAQSNQLVGVGNDMPNRSAA